MTVPFPERPAGEPGEVLGDQREQPQPDTAMNILRAIPVIDRAFTNAQGDVPQQRRRCSGEEVASIVHEQCAERRDEKWRQFYWPVAGLSRPCGDRQRYPMGPELLLRLNEQSPRVRANEDLLAQTCGGPTRPAGAENPNLHIPHYPRPGA